jgi:sporulation protein YlmC with PRC-barrel domain
MNTIINANVQSRNGEIIGEIENLVVDRRGRITHAIIDVGGFLGIGEKQVAVPFDRLEDIGPYFVMYPGTEAQLESMTAFDPSKSVGMKQDKDQE